MRWCADPKAKAAQAEEQAALRALQQLAVIDAAALLNLPEAPAPLPAQQATGPAAAAAAAGATATGTPMAYDVLPGVDPSGTGMAGIGGDSHELPEVEVMSPGDVTQPLMADGAQVKVCALPFDRTAMCDVICLILFVSRGGQEPHSHTQQMTLPSPVL